MAGEDDEVIVSLSGDTSTTDVKINEKKVVAADGTGTVSFNDEDGADPIEDLKKQFGQMSGKIASTSAVLHQTQQQLADTTQRLQRAESAVVVSQIDTVEQGIQAAEQEAQNAERFYAQAFEAGDAPAMARAQRAMARAETDLSKLREAKQDLQEAAKRQPARQDPTHTAPRQPPADPIEAATRGMSPRSAAWIRSHPECITDPKMNARMLAAHNLAIADDIAPDTDEYFQRIEAGVKTTAAKKVEPQQKTTGDGRRPSSAAASGAGSSGGLNGGGTEVRLTKREAESATDGTLVWNYDDPTGQNRFKKGEPIGLAEMARRKHEGMKAGLYDRNSFEA